MTIALLVPSLSRRHRTSGLRPLIVRAGVTNPATTVQQDKTISGPFHRDVERRMDVFSAFSTLNGYISCAIHSFCKCFEGNQVLPIPSVISSQSYFQSHEGLTGIYNTCVVLLRCPVPGYKGGSIKFRTFWTVGCEQGIRELQYEPVLTAVLI